MFVHSVYFQLKDNLTDEEINAFREGLESLRQIEQIRHLWVGQPVHYDSPNAREDFTFGLVTVFAGKEDHDAYQAHSLHQAFLENFAGYWDAVTAYNFQ